MAMIRKAETLERGDKPLSRALDYGVGPVEGDRADIYGPYFIVEKDKDGNLIICELMTIRGREGWVLVVDGSSLNNDLREGVYGGLKWVPLRIVKEEL